MGGGWASRIGPICPECQWRGRLDWADSGEMSLGGHWAGCSTHLDSSLRDPPTLGHEEVGGSMAHQDPGGTGKAAASA